MEYPNDNNSNQQHSPEKRTPNKFANWLKTSITARLAMVGFLTLALLIPLSYISSLIRERAFRQSDVVQEINAKWGESVIVYGPILKLPYKSYSEKITYNDKIKTHITEIETSTKYAYIFPETLDATANVESKTLNRGNYESVVYTSVIDFKGDFISPELETKGIKPEDIIWDQASFIVKTSNLKGIKGELKINVNANDYAFETNFNNNKNNNYNHLDVLESTFINTEDLPSITGQKMPYNFKMSHNGSTLLQIIPIGKTTTLSMKSNWENPSFTGEFLPNDKTKDISSEGFKADWKVTHLNRAFSQQHLGTIPTLNQYAFGTKFLILVDDFQQSERSAKYGFLVIGLTFLLFFLIQTLSKINIHPFQYLMIGLALLMFYTLLVSISEHSNFFKAYIIAGTAVILLITLYSKSVLKNWKFPIFVGLSLTALYSFIFVIIQLENYALLVGSLGLFTILALVMFVSRKIDWNNG